MAEKAVKLEQWLTTFPQIMKHIRVHLLGKTSPLI